MAWTHNQNNNSFAEAPLEKTNYDRDYYTANIGQYSYGADYFFLTDMGIGLIIYDNKSSRFTSSTVGFRRLGKTKHFEATTSYYDKNEDGETVVAGILCGYEEP